jgi:hypothetical protein
MNRGSLDEKYAREMRSAALAQRTQQPLDPDQHAALRDVAVRVLAAAEPLRLDDEDREWLDLLAEAMRGREQQGGSALLVTVAFAAQELEDAVRALGQDAGTVESTLALLARVDEVPAVRRIRSSTRLAEE